MYRYLLFGMLLVLAVGFVQPEKLCAQKPASGFAPEKQGKRKRKKAFVPDSPEQVQKKKNDEAKKVTGSSDGEGSDEQKLETRGDWRRYFRIKKKEYDEHHERIQTKEVRKRMKKNKKKSKKINDHKKPPFWKRLFKKRKR